MMTMSNNVTLGITFLAIICVVIVAIVSTTSSLLHANDIDSVDAPKASMLLRKKRSRQLWTPARDVGEVPVEIKESVDPHLLDFVVAGFQKCGTTYLQNKILYPSERLFIPHSETHFLQNDKYNEFVAEFENVTKSNNDNEETKNDNGDHHGEAAAADADNKVGTRKKKVTGYKAPFELGHERSLRSLETLFPDVRMIITLRHPVLQFESLYNYKLRTLPYLIPSVENFVGLCGELCPTWQHTGTQNDYDVNTDFDNEHDFKSYLQSTMKEETSATNSNVVTDAKMVTKNNGKQCVSEGLTFCTGESNYHQYLSRLGLTPMNTQEELDLLGHHRMPIHNFTSAKGHDKKGKLFLIEIGQFDNRKNQTMADDIVTDLELFLELDTGDLPRIPHRNGDTRPKKQYDYPEDRKGQILDICLDRYKPLRETLMETSQKASKWIVEYLLASTNRRRVVVSNVNMFIDMINEWTIDPCLDRNGDEEN